ncbi:MAG: hypothetical protein WDN72_00110 [Alphaproteobacteria bacterium]
MFSTVPAPTPQSPQWAVPASNETPAQPYGVPADQPHPGQGDLGGMSPPACPGSVIGGSPVTVVGGGHVRSGNTVFGAGVNNRTGCTR